MSYIIYIILGFLPSIIWLLFYLRKDSHPESNKMILKIFVYGMIIAVIAAIVEIGILKGSFALLGQWFESYPFLSLLAYHFIAIALIEEFFKYLVVKEKVLRNSEFDEPVDAMIYMIIVALGFAALENIIVLLPANRLLIETMSITAFRFIGATFLHALASGTIGFFLALSLYNTKKRTILIISGIIIATLLHGIYNISIIKIADSFYYILIPIILLIGLALFISFGFRKLKKIASTCKIK